MADTSTRRTKRSPAESTEDPRPTHTDQARARSRNQAGAKARVESRAEARAEAAKARSEAAKPDSDAQDWRTNTTSLDPVKDDATVSRRVGASERRRTPARSSSSSPSRPASTAARVEQPRVRSRGPRRARLRLTRLDPWSVMKTSFLLSIAFAVVTIVAVVIVWTVLGAAGVWDSINASVESVIGGEESQNFDVENYVGMTRVLGFTMLVSVIDVILITAVATLGAFVYNMSAALLGGVEVTLAEDPR